MYQAEHREVISHRRAELAHLLPSYAKPVWTFGQVRDVTNTCPIVLVLFDYGLDVQGLTLNNTNNIF